MGDTDPVPAATATGGPPADDYRPRMHLTAGATWMNDPNGLIHHDGRWHAFFQNNPEGTAWGNMSWGHAVSTDLLHWEPRPLALRFDEQEHVYSGSVVHDRANSSGLAPAGAGGPLVAVYTSAFQPGSPHHGEQAQSLAHSLDGGETWTKHDGNPVLRRGSAEFRDPKVFAVEHEGRASWVVVAVEAVARTVELYRSEDLRNWHHLSSFGPAGATGGVWECPDLFPLPLDGNPDDVRWVLLVNINPGGPNGGSACQYFTGRFDGAGFVPDDPGQEPRWLDLGHDFYAAVSFADAPGGRRVVMGWVGNWDYAGTTPSTGWRGSLSLPRELSLRTVDGRPHLVQTLPDEIGVAPVDEARHAPAAGGPAGELPLADVPQRLRLVATPGEAGVVGVDLLSDDAAVRIAYDAARGELSVDRGGAAGPPGPAANGFRDVFTTRSRAPLDAGGELRLDVHLDRSCLEVFAQDGRLTMTELVFPVSPFDRARPLAVGDGARVRELSSARLVATGG